jgi:hypothetical protein
MQYDCVIATKNRVGALRMSIPLILKQDVLPERLIVIDASDDHDSVRTEVREISERLGFEKYHCCKVRRIEFGSTAQRRSSVCGGARRDVPR